jgi:hypothetical protein
MGEPIQIRDVTPRRLGIKNLLSGLAERGKIKIGNKGETRKGSNGDYQLPQKLDHFLITTTARGGDGNFLRDAALHNMLGEKPVEIPVVLLYDDIDLNFQTRYCAYVGRTAWCSGDGEQAERIREGGGRVIVPCTCERVEQTYKGPDKCKPNGKLSVIIQGAEVVGGVWVFRTTSFHTIRGILSSLALIQRITGGPLAGIPLMLTLAPRTVADPNTGKNQTVYIVSLEFRGSMESLQDRGYSALLTRQQHHVRIEAIEEDARRMLAANPRSFGAPAPDEVDDDIDEFYPETSDVEAQGEPVATQAQAPRQRTGRTGSAEALDQMTDALDDPPAHVVEPIDPETPSKPEPPAKSQRKAPAGKAKAVKPAPAADPETRAAGNPVKPETVAKGPNLF